MNVIAELRERLKRAIPDPELRRLCPGLAVNVDFRVDNRSIHLRIQPDTMEVLDHSGATTHETTITVSAEEDAWREVLAVPPPPTFHSFTALQIANPRFDVAGEPIVVAQARAMLERVLELVVKVPENFCAPVERNLGQVRGQYRSIDVAKRAHDVYFETAGDGMPILFLHTAGADGRQFIAQMADVDLGRRFRMYAFDLPFHGKSFPPRDWDGGPYKLTADLYQSWCAAFIDQIIGAPAIVVGGSMGAAMALVLAAHCPKHVRGVVALEPPYKSPGRRNPFQNHVAVHGGLHNGAFVRGLMSPSSPVTDRRRASWIYSQGGPGVYPGDLAFYSDEFDGSVIAPRIDARKTPVALLSGTYDYSATPEDGARLAKAIPGSLFIRMDGLGHFPMCENPDFFRPFLMRGLEFVSGGMR